MLDEPVLNAVWWLAGIAAVCRQASGNRVLMPASNISLKSPLGTAARLARYPKRSPATRSIYVLVVETRFALDGECTSNPSDPLCNGCRQLASK